MANFTGLSIVGLCVFIILSSFIETSAGETGNDSTPRFLRFKSPFFGSSQNAVDFNLMNLCARGTLGPQYVFNPIQSRSMGLWNLFLNGKLTQLWKLQSGFKGLIRMIKVLKCIAIVDLLVTPFNIFNQLIRTMNVAVWKGYELLRTKQLFRILFILAKSIILAPFKTLVRLPRFIFLLFSTFFHVVG